MRPVALIVALSFGMPCAPVIAGEETRWPEPGTRVRWTAPCDSAARQAAGGRGMCSFEGEFVAAQAGAVRLAMAESTAGYDMEAIGRFEVSQGRRSHRLAGAGIGFLAGAGVTYLLLNTGGSTSLCDRSANQDAIRLEECLGLAALGGVAGAGLGFVIGGFLKTERWREVPLDRLRGGLAPGEGLMMGLASGRGMTIGLALAF